MNKRNLSIALLSVLLLSLYVPLMAIPKVSAVYDPTHLVYDTIGEPETTDPAWCYDTSSAELIYNVYDPLIFFDVDYKPFYVKGDNTPGGHPYETGKVDKFRHVLATQGILEDINEVDPVTGLTFLQKYTWKIRGIDQRQKTWELTSLTIDWTKPIGTWWHELAPELSTMWDVHSFYDNGDGVLSASDTIDVNTEMYPQPWSPPWVVRVYFHVDFVDTVNKIIKVTEVPVYFHNGAILTAEDVEYSFERAFVQDRTGGPTWMLWEPFFGTYGADVADPLQGVKIDHAIQSADLDGDGVEESVVMKLASHFPTLPFLQILAQSWSSILNKAWCVALGDFDGDFTRPWADIVTMWRDPAVSFIEGDMMGTGPYRFDYWEREVSYQVLKFDDYWNGWPATVFPYCNERKPSYIEVVTWMYFPAWTTRYFRFIGCESDITDVPRMYRDQVLGYPGILNYWPFAAMQMTAYYFTFDVEPTSTYLGPGFDPATPYAMGTDRMRVDMFSDLNARKGFSYAFDYGSWLQAAYLGEGTKPCGPWPDSIAYYNYGQETYNYDLVKAEAYLRAAFGGDIWTNGFRFTITYNVGNVPRETAAFMMRDKIQFLNPLFTVDCVPVAWGSTYLAEVQAHQCPLFIIGWLADYPDPHNWVFPFMHSSGTFVAAQRYSNPTVDALCVEGINTPDSDPHRQEIYYELQSLYFEDVPSVALVMTKGRRFEKWYMRNYYYNPIHPSDGGYYYERWKSVLPNARVGDLNGDGAVNILDAAVVSAHWYLGPPVGPDGYSPNADATGGVGGTTGSLWGPVKYIPDGRVDIVDASLVSAEWGT